MEWRIGCSGFHYKDWKETFYPKGLAQSKWFDYYARHFNTLELNVTFYRFPQLSFLQNWYAKSPADFRFAVKAPRAITHYKKFNDCYELLTSFYDTINTGLQDKLGPVLFQLPPSYDYTEERLERIITNLDPGFKNVLEFRHDSWWNEQVYQRLAAKGITFSGQSHPKLNDELIQNTDVVYYRFHGVPTLYLSAYSDDFLRKVVEQVKSRPDTGEAWFYFNNTMTVAAIENAKAMLGMI